MFSGEIEALFRNIKFVSIMLVITGCWLFLGNFFLRLWEKKRSFVEKPNMRDAILIGIAQAVSLLPGISRSGATICSGLMLKIKKEEAFRFSFLLSIPAITGALLYKLKDFSMMDYSGKDLFTYAIGATIAFFVGLLSLKFLLTIIRKQKLYIFGVYCIIVGVMVFFMAGGNRI